MIKMFINFEGEYVMRISISEIYSLIDSCKGGFEKYINQNHPQQTIIDRVFELLEDKEDCKEIFLKGIFSRGKKKLSEIPVRIFYIEGFADTLLKIYEGDKEFYFELKDNNIAFGIISDTKLDVSVRLRSTWNNLQQISYEEKFIYGGKTNKEDLISTSNETIIFVHWKIIDSPGG